MPTCTISKIILQPTLSNQIQASFYYKTFSGSWVLIATDITIDTDGNLSSPISFLAEYETTYTLRADNEQCETMYQEDFYLPDIEDNLLIDYDGFPLSNGQSVFGGLYLN